MPGPAPLLRPPDLRASSVRRVASRATDMVLSWVVWWAAYFVAAEFFDDERVLGLALIGAVAAIGVEATLVAATGGTFGHLVTGQRVRRVDGGRVAPGAALGRSAGTVSLCLLPIVGPVILAGSVLLDPLLRGFHDRQRDLIVVRDRLLGPVDLESLAPIPDIERCTVFGTVADLNRRRRARAHRLDGQTWLVAGLALVVVAYAVDSESALGEWVDGVVSTQVFWWAVAAWLIALVVDETVTIHRHGQTPGHRIGDLRVLDMVTGQPPSWPRSLVRALVVTALTTIPPLHLVGAGWLKVSASNRGPHDLLARTVVVLNGTEPSQPPPPNAYAWLPPAPSALAVERSPGPLGHLPPPPAQAHTWLSPSGSARAGVPSPGHVGHRPPPPADPDRWSSPEEPGGGH